MLALGRRLVARGHEVTFETWRRWREHVEAEGMRFVPAPEYPVFPTREQPLKPYEAVVLATGETRPAVVRSGADVVVHDILTLAPALAAELEGIPAATLIPHLYPATAPGAAPYGFGARLPRTQAGAGMWRVWERPVRAGLRQGRGELNETRVKLGLPPTPRLYGGLSERLCIVATFPQLEYPRSWPPSIRVVGPLSWEPPYRDVELPPGEDPLILVAPSTAHDSEHRLLRAAVRGLAREPVRVLAATNRMPGAEAPTEATARNRRPPAPPPLAVPGNARVVDWVSYGRTMPRCSLVVTHAGHGTLARALEAGCPVLCVPHSGDMGENAARADWAGVGIRLPWRFLSRTTLTLAVRRALADPSLAARARELARWAAANDGAERAAALVEQLAASPADARGRTR